MSKTFLNLESLDGRALPSATFANGVLTITGTDGRDNVEVREVGDQLFIKGQRITVGANEVRSIPSASVTRINVSTGAGDDRIDLRKTSVPAVVDAGAGRDVARGGSGNDTIGGGANGDWIYAGRGNDTVSGDDGNDWATGDAGNDTIRGRGGDDQLRGSDGNDDVRGEDGNDSVRGGFGDDNCDGGLGNDRVRGGRGSDGCSGGSGNDDVSDDEDEKFWGTITDVDLGANQVTVRRGSGAEVTVSINSDTELERFGDDVDLSSFRV